MIEFFKKYLTDSKITYIFIPKIKTFNYEHERFILERSKSSEN